MYTGWCDTSENAPGRKLYRLSVTSSSVWSNGIVTLDRMPESRAMAR
jgi:hypothetical protein